MKKRIIGLFAIVLLLGVFIISCDEDLLNLPQVEEEDKTTADDNAAAELKVARVFENINNFGISEQGKKNANLEGCPNVSWEGLTLSLDFNDCSDGSSGVLIATFSAVPTYSTTGLTATVTFDNYVNEGTGMNGKLEMVISNLAIGGDVGPTFSIKVLEDLTFREGSDSHMWKTNSERTFNWLSGFSTLDDNSDDVYSLDGISEGINSDGIPYQVNISTALVFDNSCDWIPIGVMSIKNNFGTEDEVTITIDFSPGEGSEIGECDSWISISKGSFTIKFNTEQ